MKNTSMDFRKVTSKCDNAKYPFTYFSLKEY